ncbi:carbohydrate ABC transporter permease [Martelella radicis]|uniref:Multiple sugar transport system permease protein n=1 Tax=Martelella radicis TaxID=1397476 RepID=A0A7W6P8R3_9HYPH|nr:sugar ABC transporter permease [Martelella radicis]MBB4120970.1 multiple sugar transport system permease protein [Martelella radicis]
MRNSTTGWLLIAPTLFILFITGLLPFLYVLVVSFFDWNTFAQNPEPQFAGVENFRRLVFDPGYLKSVWLTLKFTFFVLVSELLIGFALAKLLMRNVPLKGLFRTIHTLPLMIAPIAVGATWRLLTVPGLGPIPYYMQKWFDTSYVLSRFPDQAFATVVIMDIWHWTPLITLTLLAGLSNLPEEPLEQARIDGAGEWRLFWDITLPFLKPVLLTTIFIRLMDALRTVEEVWMLTGGGPGAETRFVGLYIWRVVFPKTDYGYGSAISLVTLYLTIVMCWLLYVAMTGMKENRE